MYRNWNKIACYWRNHIPRHFKKIGIHIKKNWLNLLISLVVICTLSCKKTIFTLIVKGYQVDALLLLIPIISILLKVCIKIFNNNIHNKNDKIITKIFIIYIIVNTSCYVIIYLNAVSPSMFIWFYLSYEVLEKLILGNTFYNTFIMQYNPDESNPLAGSSTRKRDRSPSEGNSQSDNTREVKRLQTADVVATVVDSSEESANYEIVRANDKFRKGVVDIIGKDYNYEILLGGGTSKIISELEKHSISQNDAFCKLLIKDFNSKMYIVYYFWDKLSENTRNKLANDIIEKKEILDSIVIKHLNHGTFKECSPELKERIMASAANILKDRNSGSEILQKISPEVFRSPSPTSPTPSPISISSGSPVSNQNPDNDGPFPDGKKGKGRAY